MTADTAIWQTLLQPESAALRQAAAAVDPTDVAAIARLRRHHSAELVRAAIELGRAREKARAKFGSLADALVADAVGIEQASSLAVARYKAGRFAQALVGQTVVDLCCGIGGDTLALQQAGLKVLAIDRDPLRAWMTQQNARSAAAVADVDHLQLGGRPFHLDPARRDERGRTWRLADYQPGPGVITRLLDQSPAAAIKLSPGVDLNDLAAQNWPGELEFISEVGRLVQAVLWTGQLQSAPRRATRIEPDGNHVTLAGSPDAPPIGNRRRYLYTVDPAVERAELLGSLCQQLDIHAIHPRLGLLTADRIIHSPWLTGFECLAEMPWRLKHVQQWLHDHNGGIVEVKTRGKAVDPDPLHKQLRGTGDTPFVVFVLRWDQRLIALIARRIG